MSEALTAAMAADLDLPDGYQVVWAAIDPSTGADVPGVVVSGVSIFGTSLGDAGGGQFQFVLGNPLLIGSQITA